MSNPNAHKKGSATSTQRTRIAILGYGNDAREHALALREAKGDYDVVIGVRPGGMSWLRAASDGFAPMPSAAAVAGAQIVALLVPDEDQPSVYFRAAAPNLAPGALLVFGRGHALYTGAVDAPPGTDCVLVTKAESLDRLGAPACRVAVHRDATGRALDRAITYARAAFGELARALGTTTVAEEVEADLAAYEARVGGPEALLAELDEVLVRGNHEPDEAKLAYYERLRALVARRVAVSSARAKVAPAAPGSLPAVTAPLPASVAAAAPSFGRAIRGVA